jgi:cellulose synthase operon protein C
VADNKGESLEGLSAPPLNRAAVSAAVPLNARLAHEIPKPKDWQAFQRLCVLLFQAELNDPNAQEYGRVGARRASG